MTVIYGTVHGSRAYGLAAGCLLGLLLLSGCTRSSTRQQGVPGKVTLVGALFSSGAGEPTTVVMKEALARFERETGIAVENVPPSAERGRRLPAFLGWLKARAPTPDVYRADVSEIGVLADHMLDLAPYLGEEAKQPIPAVMSNYWIKDRLVALPLYTDVGVLFYRTDLLTRYGFEHPPVTWDELERMAVKIQAGERTAGRPEFWGLAWPGRADDDLFCVALEVQATHGGGRIIEADRTISVNNPHTVRALARMRSWVGRISPTGITAYGPLDARGLWQSGNAAFLLSWPYVYARSQDEDSVVHGKLDLTVIPTGGAGHEGALGGWQLSVSRYSKHPREAAALLRFLTRPEEQVRRAVALSGLPPTLAVYDHPEVVRAYPYFPRIKKAIQHGTVPRPWVAAGPAYRHVAEAYTTAVYAVLSGQAEAAKAVANLEARLVAITGFRTGPPPSPSASDTSESASVLRRAP